ncbi:hypothetical protein B0T17DRAFT_179778 [Bombardia bombarda]|uniref:Secreted protein n=1 Tax=Bombardia bombarda TaxID=252184 RepID=A0AA39X8C0_9PEZI|nr:hypothetical protein B0T17DRAFT_179778 [Bombardia bombarda]
MSLSAGGRRALLFWGCLHLCGGTKEIPSLCPCESRCAPLLPRAVRSSSHLLSQRPSVPTKTLGCIPQDSAAMQLVRPTHLKQTTLRAFPAVSHQGATGNVASTRRISGARRVSRSLPYHAKDLTRRIIILVNPKFFPNYTSGPYWKPTQTSINGRALLRCSLWGRWA